MLAHFFFHNGAHDGESIVYRELDKLQGPVCANPRQVRWVSTVAKVKNILANNTGIGGESPVLSCLPAETPLPLGNIFGRIWENLVS